MLPIILPHFFPIEKYFFENWPKIFKIFVNGRRSSRKHAENTRRIPVHPSKNHRLTDKNHIIPPSPSPIKAYSRNNPRPGYSMSHSTLPNRVSPKSRSAKPVSPDHKRRMPRSRS